jgi:hypothetical protein
MASTRRARRQFISPVIGHDAVVACRWIRQTLSLFRACSVSLRRPGVICLAIGSNPVQVSSVSRRFVSGLVLHDVGPGRGNPRHFVATKWGPRHFAVPAVAAGVLALALQ